MYVSSVDISSAISLCRSLFLGWSLPSGRKTERDEMNPILLHGIPKGFCVLKHLGAIQSLHYWLCCIKWLYATNSM